MENQLTDEQRNAMRAEILANRMAIRAILAVTARLANPSDPREFVSQVEEALFAQLDVPGPLFDGADASAREVARNGVSDITGRMNWGEI